MLSLLINGQRNEYRGLVENTNHFLHYFILKMFDFTVLNSLCMVSMNVTEVKNKKKYDSANKIA
jgi:hypothetical protein